MSAQNVLVLMMPSFPAGTRHGKVPFDQTSRSTSWRGFSYKWSPQVSTVLGMVQVPAAMPPSV